MRHLPCIRVDYATAWARTYIWKHTRRSRTFGVFPRSWRCPVCSWYLARFKCLGKQLSCLSRCPLVAVALVEVDFKGYHRHVFSSSSAAALPLTYHCRCGSDASSCQGSSVANIMAGVAYVVFPANYVICRSPWGKNDGVLVLVTLHVRGVVCLCIGFPVTEFAASGDRLRWRSCLEVQMYYDHNCVPNHCLQDC